ncbi:hypothetical protein Btru_062375, partial [Bulinus truncatus]
MRQSHPLSSLSQSKPSSNRTIPSSSKMYSQFCQESYSEPMTNTEVPSIPELQQILDPNLAITCPVCNVLLESRIFYQKHMNSEHRQAGYLPYTCKLCLMGFFSASGLQKHTEAHAGK